MMMVISSMNKSINLAWVSTIRIYCSGCRWRDCSQLGNWSFWLFIAISIKHISLYTVPHILFSLSRCFWGQWCSNFSAYIVLVVSILRRSLFFDTHSTCGHVCEHEILQYANLGNGSKSIGEHATSFIVDL
jgi:hypothetical protein